VCAQGKQAQQVLTKLRNWGRSNVGRGRAFLRMSLNQHTIVEYFQVGQSGRLFSLPCSCFFTQSRSIQALVWNMELVETFYKEGALFRNEFLVFEMMEQLELVLPLQFSLTMHFSELDKVR